MNLIELNHCFIKAQLELENRLLRTEEKNFCLINQGSPPAIVMGISGKEEQLIETIPHPFPILRRFSGGGTVIVDENTLFITFICNKASFAFTPYPESILKWAASLLCPTIPNMELYENDFVIGDKKCGGNALYITKNRFLIHTSFLWDFDLEKMTLLKYPPKTPLYRANRHHESFLCKLRDHIPCPAKWIEEIKTRVGRL